MTSHPFGEITLNTMQYIEIDKLKKHLKMDAITAEDDLLATICGTAESLAASMVGRTPDTVSTFSPSEMSRFRHLCQVIAADLYVHREDAEQGRPYKNLMAEALAKSLRTSPER